MEFVLSLDSLLCPHTIGSEQEQKAAHQGTVAYGQAMRSEFRN